MNPRKISRQNNGLSLGLPTLPEWAGVSRNRHPPPGRLLTPPGIRPDCVLFKIVHSFSLFVSYNNLKCALNQVSIEGWSQNALKGRWRLGLRLRTSDFFKFFKLLLQNPWFKMYLFHPKISKTRVRASKTAKKNFRLRRAFVHYEANSNLLELHFG